MTDITDRIKEAMGSYEKLKGPFDLRFAKEALADDARTLLPEALKEIEELRGKVRSMALDSMAATDQAAENLARAEATEAKALEKAAGVAKALSEKWRDGRISPNSELHAILYREGMADGAYHIYNAIRAMKEGE